MLNRQIYSIEAFIREIKIKTGFDITIEEVITWCIEGSIQASFLFVDQSDQYIDNANLCYESMSMPNFESGWFIGQNLRKSLYSCKADFLKIKRDSSETLLPKLDKNIGGYIFYVDKRTFKNWHNWTERCDHTYVCNAFYPKPYHLYKNQDATSNEFLNNNGLSIFYKDSMFRFFKDGEPMATHSHLPIVGFRTSDDHAPIQGNETSRTLRIRILAEHYIYYDHLFFEANEINHFINTCFYSTRTPQTTNTFTKQQQRELFFQGWLAGQNRDIADVFYEKRIEIWDQLSKSNPKLFPLKNDPDNKTMARFFSKSGAKFR